MVTVQKRKLRFGYLLFKSVDVRAAMLRELAVAYGFGEKKLTLYEYIHQNLLSKVNKKDIVINNDGMMAAIMCEMDFDADITGIAGNSCQSTWDMCAHL